ncbi:hypothetical protein ACM6Q7_18585 [Peribacillus butanolivorans]|uniref:hypothetical protein n=1 Tax=Peribacillus butanolivorans TaxID=421767 RepID=UPI0039FD02D3
MLYVWILAQCYVESSPPDIHYYWMESRGDTIRLWITKDVYVRAKWDDITRLTKLFEKNKTNVDYYCNGV